MSTTDSKYWKKLTVTPTDAKRLLALCVQAETTAMMWGNYGVGKTSVVYELCDDLKKMPEKLRFEGCIIINPSQTDIIDFKLPHLSETKDTGEMISRFAYSELLPREGRWVLFVDEINTAPQSLQPTLYSLILEGRIGNYRLPAGCFRAAAGNREEDGCAAQPMSAALKDRLGLHMNVEPSPKCWGTWAAKNGIRPEIQAFVQNCPNESLFGHDVNDPCGGSTPRSLAALSRKLDALYTNGNVDASLESVIIQGTIGQGAGSVFEGFLKLYKSSIDVPNILKNPKTAEVPTRPDILFCVTFALAQHIDKKNIENAMIYLRRMPTTYAILTIDALKNKDSSWIHVSTFMDFIREHLPIFV